MTNTTKTSTRRQTKTEVEALVNDLTAIGYPVTEGAQIETPSAWALRVRTALVSGGVLTEQSPEFLAQLLSYEARYETPLFSLLVQVKAHAVWWANLLDALKREVLAG